MLLVWLKPCTCLFLSYDHMMHHTRIKLHQSLHWSLSNFWVARLVGKLSPSSTCSQSIFAMLFVVCSSGAFRATLSCSLRPSERSLSSQTSRLSLHIWMICMRVPELSLEDRCVCKSMFSSSFSRLNCFWLKKQLNWSHEIEMGNVKPQKMKPNPLHF